jgi:hypothetical protein
LGCTLREFQKELNGSTLLDAKRFRFAKQADPMPDEERRKHSRTFLTKGLQKGLPTSSEFCAYGQACIEMAHGIFRLLTENDAVLFASMIPRGSGKADAPIEGLLRKDKVFLLERFFYFLEPKKEHGLLVLDGSEKISDMKFVKQLESYFVKTGTGRDRAQWIIPTPFCVSSDMAYPIQAADICIYCINWGFRLPTHGMDEPIRQEINSAFFKWLRNLQFHGHCYKDGKEYEIWGICYVPNPCAPGRD